MSSLQLVFRARATCKSYLVTEDQPGLQECLTNQTNCTALRYLPLELIVITFMIYWVLLVVCTAP